MTVSRFINSQWKAKQRGETGAKGGTCRIHLLGHFGGLKAVGIVHLFSSTMWPFFKPRITHSKTGYFCLLVHPTFLPSTIPSVHHSVRPSFLPSIIPSLHHSVRPSFRPSMILSLHHSVLLSFCLSIILSIHDSVCDAILW